MSDKNKAVVTGAAGFIGSHIVNRLVELDYDVIAIDDLSAGKISNLNPDTDFIQADVSKYAEISQHFDGVDVVFHNAASKKTVCLADPCRDMEVNGIGTLNVLKSMVEHGCNRIIHASSGSVYGDAQYYPTDEKHPVNPKSYYGISKLSGEQYIKVFGDLNNIDWTVLRYHHVYGPRQDWSDVGGVVSIFIHRMLNNDPITIFGDGSQQRVFTYVDDVVAANMFVAKHPGSIGKVFNVASGTNTTVKQLADQITDLCRCECEITYEDWKPDEQNKFDIDNNKLKSLGFEYKTDLITGLNQTIEWFKKIKDD